MRITDFTFLITKKCPHINVGTNALNIVKSDPQHINKNLRKKIWKMIKKHANTTYLTVDADKFLDIYHRQRSEKYEVLLPNVNITSLDHMFLACSVTMDITNIYSCGTMELVNIKFQRLLKISVFIRIPAYYPICICNINFCRHFRDPTMPGYCEPDEKCVLKTCAHLEGYYISGLFERCQPNIYFGVGCKRGWECTYGVTSDGKCAGDLPDNLLYIPLQLPMNPGRYMLRCAQVKKGIEELAKRFPHMNSYHYVKQNVINPQLIEALSCWMIHDVTLVVQEFVTEYEFWIKRIIN